VRDDLRKMGVNNWKEKAQERKPWRGITEQAKTQRVVKLRKKKKKYEAPTTLLLMYPFHTHSYTENVNI